MIDAAQRCRRCGAVLNANEVKGLCPVCLLDTSLGVSDEATVEGCAEPGELGWGEAAEKTGQHEGMHRLGDYELLEEIGRGGMGVIYRARQVSLDRLVAVKTILTGPLAGPDFAHRFQTEARAAANLRHPNIVAIHEIGVQEGQPYFLMDFVEGQSLARLISRNPLPPRKAAEYLRAVARAVHYAHQQGILHRDLKPSNVLIEQGTDTPRVTDFGLARKIEGSSDLTLSGQVLGTASYMPPEQAAGKLRQLGPWSDVYALGATLYQALTGRPPHQAASTVATLKLVLDAEPASPRVVNPAIPKDLDTICLKCLAKEREGRYQSAAALADDLDRFLKNEPILARPISRVGRTWRWCRRNPAMAGLASGIAALFVVVVVGSPIALVKISAERKRALEHAKKEERQRKHAEDFLYAADMNLASRALQDGRPLHARALLSRHQPASSTDRDLREWFWRLLWDQTTEQGTTIVPEHRGIIRRLQFSADGKLLVSADDWGQVLVRSTADWRVTHEFAHSGMVDWLGLSSDNRVVMAAGRGQAQAWDLTTSNLIGRFAAPIDQRLATKGGGAAILLPSRPEIVIGGQDGWLHLYSIDGTRSNRVLRLHTNAVTTMALWAEGKMLASAGYQEPVKLWNIEDLQHPVLVRVLPNSINSNAPVVALEISPSGRWLFAGGQDRVNGMKSFARLWDLHASESGFEMPENGGSTFCATFSADSSRLFLPRGDEAAFSVWVTADKQHLGKLRSQGIPYPLVFSPRDRLLATGDLGKLRLIDLSKIPIGESGIRVLKVSPRSRGAFDAIVGEQFAVPAREGGIVLWDLCGLKPIMELGKLNAGWVWAVDLHRHFVAGISSEVRLLDLQSGKIRGRFPTYRIRIGDVTPYMFALSADGQTLAVVTAVEELSLFRTTDGQLKSRANTGGPVYPLAISPQGRHVVWSHPTLSTNVIIWDSATGAQHVFPLSRRADWPRASFSPDGTMLAFVNAGEIYLLRVEKDNVRELLRVDSGMGFMMGCTFSVGNRTLVAGSDKDRNGLLFIDTRSLQVLGNIRGTHGLPAFSTDGHNLVLFRLDGSVEALVAPTLQEIDRGTQAREN